jgi:hypothetical protein
MPTIKAPQYSKVPNPKTGTPEPCYTFSVFFESQEPTLSFVAEKKEDICLASLQNCVVEDAAWWNGFVQQFLKATAVFFSKPYTPENINKIAKHTLTGTNTNDYPASVTVQPNTIQITGGQFVVQWYYTMNSLVIDIPDLEEEPNTQQQATLPVTEDSALLKDMEELNMDQLPMDKDSTEELTVESPTKFYDKQRVKEARLKAKLALYKANRQVARYYDKYGVNDISDSDSDSEEGSDDSEEGDESEVEEVQL